MMSGDDRGVDICSRDNRVSRVASIEHSEDGVLLSDREGSYDNNN